MFCIVDWSASPVTNELMSPNARSLVGATEAGIVKAGEAAGTGVTGMETPAGADTGSGAGVGSGAFAAAVVVAALLDDAGVAFG